MEAYLDNSATTRCSKAAADMVYKLLTEDYGNPSSLHMKGVEAENYINDAKKKIAKTLRVQDKEILFTSGGTESNNTAIIGAAMANKRAGRHIITSSVEHASEQLWQTSAAGITLSYQTWNILPSKSRLTFWRSRALKSHICL